MTKKHICSEKCYCPKCGSPCYYSPYLKLHACANVSCKWEEEYLTFDQLLERGIIKRVLNENCGIEPIPYLGIKERNKMVTHEIAVKSSKREKEIFLSTPSYDIAQSHFKNLVKYALEDFEIRSVIWSTVDKDEEDIKIKYERFD